MDFGPRRRLCSALRRAGHFIEQCVYERGGASLVDGRRHVSARRAPSAKVALVHAASKTLKNTEVASKLCADASRNADDDTTRAAALDALTALAKRTQSCRGVASDAAAEALRRPLDRRRFAAAVACLKSCGSSNVTAALKTATDADACLRGRSPL